MGRKISVMNKQSYFSVGRLCNNMEMAGSSKVEGTSHPDRVKLNLLLYTHLSFRCISNFIYNVTTLFLGNI